MDVKDNNGRIPCTPTGDFNIPARIGGYEHFSALVDVLAEEDYYMIARVVAFQDPYLANLKPEQAIRNADGSLWRDRDGRLWLNPYDERNWEFIRDIALWACEMGFDEVQLDYVRFPDSARGLEQTSVLMPGFDKYDSRGDAVSYTHLLLRPNSGSGSRCVVMRKKEPRGGNLPQARRLWNLWS